MQQTEWADPDWTFVLKEGQAVASFYNVVIRDVIYDGEPLKTAGLNNVITPPDYRGKGLSTQLLRETESFLFRELECDIGLLLCADELIPFYSRLGWYQVESKVYIHQSSGKRLWSSNVMLRTVGDQLSPLEIDLNGLPW